MAKRWSEGARESARETIAAILRLPFFVGLRNGTLPRGTFENYLRRDADYLVAYARAMRQIANRLTDENGRKLFMRFADEGVAAEQTMQAGYGIHGIETADTPSTCARLICTAAESRPLAVALAAVLPCFHVYAELGRALRDDIQSTNPYADWIRAYCAPGFASDAAACAALCDRFAAQEPSRVAEMTRAFADGVAAEREFFSL